MYISFKVTHKIFNIEITCESSGSNLKQVIAGVSDLDVHNMKVISGGHVVQDSLKLSEQAGIKVSVGLWVYINLNLVGCFCDRCRSCHIYQSTVFSISLNIMSLSHKVIIFRT